MSILLKNLILNQLKLNQNIRKWSFLYLKFLKKLDQDLNLLIRGGSGILKGEILELQKWHNFISSW